MKKRFLSFVGAVTLMGGFALQGFQTTSVFADTPVTVTIDGKLQTYDQPPLIINGRTMVPLRGIFEALGAQVSWDSVTQTVTAVKGTTQLRLTIGQLKAMVNGQAQILDTAPVVINNRTLVPARFVSQVLGETVTWDNSTHTVIIQTPGLKANQALTQPFKMPVIPQQTLQNAATDDSSYWQRASKNFYLSVQTYDPGQAGTSGGSSLLNVEPGQTLYLFASGSTNEPSATTAWQVNSSDAQITPSMGDWVDPNGRKVAEATFVASKPGIYSVQAQNNNIYSVPMTIIVGKDQLIGKTIQIDPSLSGVLPFPAGGLTPAETRTGNSITYQIYPSQQGFVPVSGHVTEPVSSVVVEIDDNSDPNNSHSWTYAIPVDASGNFQDLVRSPFQGTVYVNLFVNYSKDLNSNSPYYADGNYQTNVDASPAPSLNRDLFASALMEYNLSSSFAQTASILLENSPSIQTGIAAVSNYVSETIVYNLSAYNSNQVPIQDSKTAWNLKLGVCQDYARLAASLLKSVGIPAKTLIGPANSNDPGQAPSEELHEWDQAWDGTGWIVFDPTWDCPVFPGQTTISFIQNNYYTNTDALAQSHTVNLTDQPD